MISTQQYFHAALLFLFLLCAGCATPFGQNAPTIAHVHIGHAITGWRKSPNKEGLLVVAELQGVAAKANSYLLSQSAKSGDLVKSQEILKKLANLVEPTYLDKKRVKEYGLRRATAEAITHLTLAADVADASDNVQRTVLQTTIKANAMLDKTDELTAYIDAGLKASSAAEMQVIAEEISTIVLQIAGGPEDSENYGLYEFRKDIEDMIAREDPPYSTVPRWHLFNLVKRKDGSWSYRKPHENEDDSYGS